MVAHVVSVDFQKAAIQRWLNGLPARPRTKALEFLRALTLANRLDPDHTAAVMRDFQTHSCDLKETYRELLRISEAAITAKRSQVAANDAE